MSEIYFKFEKGRQFLMMSSKQGKWFKSVFSQMEQEPPKKLPRSSSFSHNPQPNPRTSSNIFSRHKSSEPQVNCPNVDSANWIENFAPNSISDLAMHPKKISEVQDWFRNCEAIRKNCSSPMLLITGPAGSGKTATVKTVATEMTYDVIEWVNPLDIDLVTENGQTFKESQLDVFKQFLFRSSRYRSVFEALEKRVILVEDFPNVFVRDSEGFKEILEAYHIYGKAPLIFIATDTKSKTLNISYNLFPDQIRQQFNISQIRYQIEMNYLSRSYDLIFNPVSTTLMKKALKRVASLMTQEKFANFYNTPNQDVLEDINLSSQGDIRNAILNLHFTSQKGSPKVQITSKSKSSAKTRGKSKAIKGVGRDESITFMHALGRVFNPKYIEGGAPRKFLHSPEELTDSFSSEPRNFLDFVHSNYLGHFSSIENVIQAVECISCSDMLLAEYREKDLSALGLNISVRGVMGANEKPVSGWMPVKGPKRIKNFPLETELRNHGITEFITPRCFVSDYSTYARIINSR